MTTDFRALCAELADKLTQFNAWYIEDNGYGLPALEALLRRSDAALAEPDGPAVPEDREPASVIERPTVMQLIELSDEIEAAGLGQVDFARAVLARWGNRQGSLDSSPPANSEVAELVEWLYEQLHVCLQAPWTPGIKHFGRAANLLERLSPPVPVSERLPGPEDCNSDGKCWWFCFKCPGEHSYWILGEKVYCDPIYWLPAHAIPIPTAND